MIDLARRSGQIASLSARVVREGDEFSFEFGLDERCTPPGENEDAPVTHVYAVARLKDGGTPVWSYDAQTDWAGAQPE